MTRTANVGGEIVASTSGRSSVLSLENVEKTLSNWAAGSFPIAANSNLRTV